MSGAGEGEGEIDVDVGDALRLHVAWDAGRARDGGLPVVLLHGFTGSGETWGPLCAALADAYPTLAIDLPGHGRSGAPADPGRYALDRTADDVARALDVLGVARAALLGYSLGGRAALRVALRHPDRLAALVLESASPGIADAGERVARTAADAALADAVERDGVPAFVNRWERLPLWASQAGLPDAARVRQRAQRLANDARGLANSLRGAGAGADAPILDMLGVIRAPTLLVVGALDAKYVTLGHTIAHAIVGAQLAVVPGAGHAVHLERPEAFAAIVRQFLDAIPRRADTPWGGPPRVAADDATLGSR